MRAFLDYYKLLGVKTTASPLEIRKAYHQLAFQYHPDHQANKEREEKVKGIFQDLSEAYFILSDPKLRAEYDRLTHRNSRSLSHEDTQNKDLFYKGANKKGRRKIIWTPFPFINHIIDFVELVCMLIILILPFIGPFILIFLFLMMFRF